MLLKFIYLVIIFGVIIILIKYFVNKTKPKAETIPKVTSSPDFEVIKSQFANTRKNWGNDLKQIENAIQGLCTLRNEKSKSLQNSIKKLTSIQLNMDQCIQLYKKNNEEILKEKYSKLSFEKEDIEENIKTLENSILEQNIIIKNYEEKLLQSQQKLSALIREEEDAIADYIALNKINELNTKLNFSKEDEYLKNLNKVKEYNSKIKSMANISLDLQSHDCEILNQELLTAGKVEIKNSEFNQNLKMEDLWPSDNNKSNDKDTGIKNKRVTETDIDKLFK